MHYGSRSGSGKHWDFRLLMPDKKVWSWAIPKMRLPSEKGERLLSIFVDKTHSPEYMKFDGFLSNNQQVELIDYGQALIEVQTNRKILFTLDGSIYRGRFMFIRIGSKNWLILAG